MSFEKLLSELQDMQTEHETMSKALPADDGNGDEKIQAAAEGGGAVDEEKHEEPDGDEGAGAGKGDNDGDEGGKPMAKSFTLKLEDGTEVEAQDGTELVKSLTARLEATETSMTKALETAVGLIKGQGDLIKSLTEKVKQLSGEGRGRKAVVSVVEKPAPGAATMAKSEPQGLTGEQFMAKALDAQKAGRLTSIDVSMAEACLNRGEAIPASIIQRVVQ